MKIGVPRETHPGERRVALIPASVPALVKGAIIVGVAGLVLLLFSALFIVVLGPGILQVLRVLFPVIQR